MAWRAAKLRPASLELPYCSCDAASFARIIPSNDPAKIEAALLAEQKYNGNLPQRYGDYFHTQKPSSVNLHTQTDSGSDSETEGLGREACESHYVLNLDGITDREPPLTFRMGSGAAEASKEDSEVEFLTGCPGRSSRGVTPVHCGFAFGSSGMCLIKALSNTQHTILFIDNEPVVLRPGDTHVLCYRTNRFMIGKLEYSFVYNESGDQDHAAFVHQRKTTFETLGIPLPDPRLWDIPFMERRIIGPAIMQAYTGRDVSGETLVGAHLRTGEPLAIKLLTIGDDHKWKEFLTELRIVLSFPGAQGLLQALEVRCAHGHRINHENLQKKKEDAVQFCTAKDDTVYVITRLAQTNFGAYGWAKWAEKDIWFKLSLLRDILQGLKTLHDAGYMHRNISERNLLIVSEKPPVALLGDFGQSINAQTSIEEPIGPTHIRAPEIGGTAYNDKIDIWNLGFVALSMFFPMAYDIVSSGGGVQEDIWYEQMDRELRNLMIQGETEAMIARLLRGMLEHDPHKRPSAALALTYLPDFTWEGMTKQESPKIVEATTESATKRKAAALLLDGPLRKLQKRTNDFENAGADPGVDNGESVDSDDYYSDDESQYDEAFKALRRLPPDGDLRDLLIALPAGIVLPDFMARWKESDAGVFIPIPCHRRHLSKLRECFGLEETGNSDAEDSTPYFENAEVEHSSARSKKPAGQESLGASESLMNTEANRNDPLQSNEATKTVVEVAKEKVKEEVIYISSDESEEE